MNTETFEIVQGLGYKGTQSDPAEDVIKWLSSSELLRIEPCWHYLGAPGGFSWSKSWEEFSDPIEVECESFQQLQEIALEVSVKQALA